jgi:sporulation protein YlmC with PRC-barrel domain
VLSSYCYSEKEMRMSKPARIIGTTAVLVALSLATAIAQTQSPPPSPQSPPAAAAPQTAPPAVPQATPSTTPAEKKAIAPTATGNLVGLTAKSSDGTDLGKVQNVIMEPSGRTAIGIKVGGFLGFGGHIVAIPDGKFNHVGDSVQVNMTADEVDKLPRAKTQK